MSQSCAPRPRAHRHAFRRIAVHVSVVPCAGRTLRPGSHAQGSTGGHGCAKSNSDDGGDPRRWTELRDVAPYCCARARLRVRTRPSTPGHKRKPGSNCCKCRVSALTPVSLLRSAAHRTRRDRTAAARAGLGPHACATARSNQTVHTRPHAKTWLKSLNPVVGFLITKKKQKVVVNHPE